MEILPFERWTVPYVQLDIIDTAATKILFEINLFHKPQTDGLLSQHGWKRRWTWFEYLEPFGFEGRDNVNFGYRTFIHCSEAA